MNSGFMVQYSNESQRNASKHFSFLGNMTTACGSQDGDENVSGWFSCLSTAASTMVDWSCWFQ